MAPAPAESAAVHPLPLPPFIHTPFTPPAAKPFCLRLSSTRWASAASPPFPFTPHPPPPSHSHRIYTSCRWALLLASCVNAVGISWAGINAQAYVTATTFMVLANLNKFVVVGFGIVVLQEASSWQARFGSEGVGGRRA